MWGVLYEATGKEERFENVFELVKLFFCVPY